MSFKGESMEKDLLTKERWLLTEGGSLLSSGEKERERCGAMRAGVGAGRMERARRPLEAWAGVEKAGRFWNEEEREAKEGEKTPPCW